MKIYLISRKYNSRNAVFQTAKNSRRIPQSNITVTIKRRRSFHSSAGNSPFSHSKIIFSEFETKILSVFIKLRLNFTFFLLFLHHRCPLRSPDVLERFGFIRIMRKNDSHSQSCEGFPQRIRESRDFLQQSLCTADDQRISRSPGKAAFHKEDHRSRTDCKTIIILWRKHGQAPPPVPVTGRRLLLRRGYPCPGNRTLFHVRKTLAADPQSGKNRVQKPFCGQSLREGFISTHAKTKETPKESKYDKERTRCQNRR